jgi:hypothetical protein
MGLESAIEDLVCDDAEADGWYVNKLKWIGKRGALDRFFAKNGRVVLIEFKRPGGKTSAGQERELKALQAAGVECHVVDNPLTAYRILGIKR